jgi:hypothetical protein
LITQVAVDLVVLVVERLSNSNSTTRSRRTPYGPANDSLLLEDQPAFQQHTSARKCNKAAEMPRAVTEI